MFISSYSAVTSNSVEDKTKEMLNLYVKNEVAIKSFKAEFNNYLDISIPLLKKELLTKSKITTLNKNYDKFNKIINNMELNIYLKPLEEVVILIPNSNCALVSNEPNIIKAFSALL